MQVYEFQKTFLERLDECMSVLSWKNFYIPASEVKNEWSYFIELQIEPAGWQALWKIPRNLCEELKVYYPTIVCGNIEHVNFRDLSAIIEITAVEDKCIHLQERHNVALVDLWPTINQDNNELNIERTADCLDRLRFFYTHVWMPWDNDKDDDFNWVEKHLQSRIKLCFDLSQRKMNRPMASYIRSLINEAKYIHERRKLLERDLSDEDSNEGGEEHNLEKACLTQLMGLHLRLAMIRNDVEMLENPEMRQLYQEIKLKYLKLDKSNAGTENVFKNNLVQRTKPACYIVALPSSVHSQMDLLRAITNIISQNDDIYLNHSLQDVLDICKPSDKIYLSAGVHKINFLEYFFDNGLLFGLGNQNESDYNTNLASIYSPDDNCYLLIFDGDFTLENVLLDCQNIRTGVLVKHGNITLKNCKLIGSGKSSVQKGILGCGTARINMENCSLENFATGIALNNSCSLTLKNVTVNNCNVGLEVSESSVIKFENSTFQNCEKSAIFHNGLILNQIAEKYMSLENITDIKMHAAKALTWTGECTFIKCKRNIIICNILKSMVHHRTFESMYDLWEVPRSLVLSNPLPTWLLLLIIENVAQIKKDTCL